MSGLVLPPHLGVGITLSASKLTQAIGLPSAQC